MADAAEANPPSVDEGAGAAGGAAAPAAGKGKCEKVKVICLGDSAVGKSKLIERFLMEKYQPQQMSTFALTLFKHETEVDGKPVEVDFWDTAGQERFAKMHTSYYDQAHACILVFDIERKVTYKNMTNWYKELRKNRPDIPCMVVANKIDVDPSIVKKKFGFAEKHGLGNVTFVSAATGVNVVKVFKEAIDMAYKYKTSEKDASKDSDYQEMVRELLAEDN